MYKVDLFKVLTTVAMLCFTSVVNAAPLMPGEQFALEEPLDEGSGNSGASTASSKLPFKLLRTKQLTTFPTGDGKTLATVFNKIISSKTTRPKESLKTLDTRENNAVLTLTLLSDDHNEVMQATTSGHLGSPRTAYKKNSPAKSRRFSRSRGTDYTADLTDYSTEQGGSHPGAREELVKMLSALEEIHKFINDTRSHKSTIRTKGNANGRISGKKNKMFVTDGNLKSTTATTVDSSGLSPKASTDQMDNKLSGKIFKKSPPSSKKTNKRVCFWKYCSQN